MGGDECCDFKNPIGRTFLSGNGIFAETGKSRLSVKSGPVGGASLLGFIINLLKNKRKDRILMILT
jgi:hypothetical protein